MRVILGIDPGLDGGLAVLADGVAVYDTPTLTVAGGKGHRREYNLTLMVNLIRAGTLLEDYHVDDVSAFIEAVHAMPGQGVRSMFTMGFGLGLWTGILAGLRIPYTRVAPQRWKKAMMDGMGKEKDASRLRAQQLFPTAELHLKKHHGRADALLIAEYGRRVLTEPQP